MVINPLEIEYDLIDVSKAVRGNHNVHIIMLGFEISDGRQSLDHGANPIWDDYLN